MTFVACSESHPIAKWLFLCLILIGTSSLSESRRIRVAAVLPRRDALYRMGGGVVVVKTAIMGGGPAIADNMESLSPVFVEQQEDDNNNNNNDWKNRIQTRLGKERLMGRELSPLGMKNPFATENELYYAPFLFGSWNVTCTLIRKVYPFGTSFVPSNSLIDGSPRNRNEQVGSVTSYEAHYYSTLANDVSNQVTVQLGLGVPKSRIIADRGYNAISVSRAYQQLATVQQVQWDPTKDPTRVTLTYESLSNDMRPIGPRRTEIYIRSRRSEEDGNRFCCSELSRIVTLSPGNVFASDTESITEFVLSNDMVVRASQRLAVYLTPNPNSREGLLWQQVGGKAVALYDYDITMKRITEPFLVNKEETVTKACVATPKGYTQCE